MYMAIPSVYNQKIERSKGWAEVSLIIDSVFFYWKIVPIR